MLYQLSKEKQKIQEQCKTVYCFNCIKSINKPDINNILPRQSILVPITNIASLQLKAKVEWFSEQKAEGFQDGSFRNDNLCLLILASYFVMDVPDNLKYLLEYRQEEI